MPTPAEIHLEGASPTVFAPPEPLLEALGHGFHAYLEAFEIWLRDRSRIGARRTLAVLIDRMFA